MLEFQRRPTQYVQDTMPDTTKTIPDPKDATKADPGSERDHSQGRLQRQLEIDVMVAADAKGNAINGSDGNPIVIPTDKDGKSCPPTLPAGAAKAVPQLVTVSYQGGIHQGPKTGIETFNYHNIARSVVAPHKFSYVIIQACIAILILVGFESVTSMGEEAKNAKRDIPKAVILSLAHSGRLLLPL